MKRPLTERERDVINLLVTDMTSKEIAKELGLAVGTVKKYLQHAMDKTDTRNRVELAMWHVAHQK